jgi:putative phage-type endonuclease
MLDIRTVQFADLDLVGKFVNQSAEWAKAREGAIGGSQVGTILGLNPWESPLTCFYKMRGEIPSSVEPNLRMRLGTLLEQPLLELFQEQHTDWMLYDSATYAHKKYPFLHANPDGFYQDESGELHLIEVKTSRDFWSDGVPLHYRAQVMFYLWMFGLRHAKVVALTAGDYNEFDVWFDEFEAMSMMKQVVAFYDMVQKNERPAFDGAENTYVTIRSLNPDVSDDRVELPQQLGIDLVNTAHELDELGVKMTELKSRVLDCMGDARVGFIDVDGEEFVVATRQKRGNNAPHLVIKKGK